MKGFKKVLALMLSFAMVFSTLTVTALADGEIEVGTLDEIKAIFAQDHESVGTKTYKLTADINNGTGTNGGQNLYVVSGDDVTLDLNGHTLRSAAFRELFVVYGTLTVIDSVGGGTLEAYYNMTSTRTDYSRAVSVKSGGTFNLKSGTVTSNCINGTYDSRTTKSTLKGNLIYAPDGATFNMTGGTVTECPPLDVTTANGGMIYLGNGTHTISGGTISNGISNSGGNIMLNGGTLTISGDTVITGGTARFGGNIRTYNGATLNINGGTISNGVSSPLYGKDPSGANLYLQADTTTVINGCTISGTSPSMNNYNVYARGTLTVNDAAISSVFRTSGTTTFNGGVYTGAFYKDAAGTEITVNGGWYANQQPQEGKTALGDGKYATGICADAPDADAPYAVVDSETYTVSYKLPDGTPVVADDTVNHGTQAVIADYTPETGSFGGWYYDAELTQPAPAVGATAEYSQDTTLYAWVAAALHNITVNIDGTEDTSLSGIYEEGDTFTLPAAPEVSYYTFAGYAAAEGGDVQYQAGDAITVNAAGEYNFYTVYTENARIASFTTGETVSYAHEASDFITLFNAITADTDVVLLDDITVGERVGAAAASSESPVAITLDLNGCTYTYTGASRGAFAARNYITITLKDTSEGGTGAVRFESTYTGTHSYVYANEFGRGIIESGTYTGDYSAGTAFTTCNNDTYLSITGGVFDQDPSANVGGAYEVKADTPSAGLYTVVEAEVITYYATVSVNGGEAVSYTSYYEALDAVRAITDENAVVVLNVLLDSEDATQNYSFASGMDLTINLGGHTITRTTPTRAFSISDGVDLTITNGTYIGSGSAYTAGNGGFINVAADSGSTVTLNEVTVSGILAGSTRSGGLFRVQKGTELTITGCTFTDISAGANAGLIYAQGAVVTMTDTAISNVTAGSHGGVVLLERNSGVISELTMNNVDISNCSAARDGGTIYISTGCTATIDAESSFTGCSGKNGGVIYLYNTASANAETGITTTGDAPTLYFNGTVTDCAGTGETSDAPIFSRGLVYVNGVLTNDGIVYQENGAGRFYGVGSTVSDTVTATFIAEVVLPTGSTDAVTLTYANGSVTKTSEGTLSGGRYQFETTVNVDRIADALTLTVLTGGTTAVSTMTYSILDYMNAAAAAAETTDAQRTLMANLITFAEALINGGYAGEGATAITEGEWVATAKTADAPVAANAKATVKAAADSANYKIRSATLNVAEKISPKFLVKSLAGGYVKVSIGGEYQTIVSYTSEEAATYDSAEKKLTFNTDTDGVYFRTERFAPTEYDSAVVVELYNAEGTLVHSVQYSVNAYCVSMAGSYAELTTAIYNYGTAAAALQ